MNVDRTGFYKLITVSEKKGSQNSTEFKTALLMTRW
jgi:hypothetical protein